MHKSFCFIREKNGVNPPPSLGKNLSSINRLRYGSLFLSCMLSLLSFHVITQSNLHTEINSAEN